MTYRGHIKNGQVMLDFPAQLQEGASVNVVILEAPNKDSLRPRPERRFQPIEMPGGPLADDIVRDRADAIQLACALAARQLASPDDVIFVACDAELNAAARAEGLTVFDPSV